MGDLVQGEHFQNKGGTGLQEWSHEQKTCNISETLQDNQGYYDGLIGSCTRAFE